MSYGYQEGPRRPPPDQYGHPEQTTAYPSYDQYGHQNPDYQGGYGRQQQPGPPRPPEKKTLSRNAKIGIGAGVALLLFVIGLAAGGGSGESTAPAASTVSIPSAPAVAPATAVAAPSTVAPATVAPAAPVTPAAEQKAVPNVVGMNHQAAQDALQAAGFYLLAEEDATGQGRFLVWDRNWQVVSQAPAAGTVIGTDQQVLLRSKKDTDP